jgi:dTDP-L-rhamnose 4-epimerase
MTRVLITGGAGFIGSHIADGLLERGYQVRVFDNLSPQVHGDGATRPGYLNSEVELIIGDVRDREALKRALDGVQIVYHQAAVVGIGQSMYEIHRYVDHNTLGTANLMDILVNEKVGVERLVVASSNSIYGEGRYECSECGVVFPKLRTEEQLQARIWEVLCPHCSEPVRPLPTDEDKPLFPTSVYAINKRDQEELCLTIGRAYDIPTVGLRYFITYGPRQALSNPYAGAAPIFVARIMSGEPPLVFEDGQQTRDLVHVSDIVQANLLVLEKPEADYQILNVGTGRATTITDLALLLANRLGRSDLEPKVVYRFRAGDVRHCYADISKIEKLGFVPQVSLEDGIDDLIEWVLRQEPDVLDKITQAVKELENRGLFK